MSLLNKKVFILDRGTKAAMKYSALMTPDETAVQHKPQGVPDQQ